jgi:hypothetical protein
MSYKLSTIYPSLQTRGSRGDQKASQDIKLLTKLLQFVFNNHPQNIS